ncbi:AraC family transcriptional regulator [Aquimarina sp. D1M17]|uniref:AraC family transcriptional regulator n=1 Tax=Aquimarina acroporae TaxID=2937283 RepID=UPI0020BFB450|nr:AraC family transcriptional regulator [Aquimarina acroporae]MCK8523091.1 AraC family transcriptional regulator [Aquimarina acroporae]
MNLWNCIKSVFLISFIYQSGFAQSYQIADSLKNKMYEELRDGFFENLEIDKKKSERYFQAYWYKGRINNDSTKMMIAYLIKSNLYGNLDIRKIKAFDTAIFYSKNVKRLHYPELLYNKKGLYYNDRREFSLALRSYISALEFSKKNKNPPYISLVKHNIGCLKRELGMYEDAKKLFKECLIWEENNMIKNRGKWDSIGYLQTLAEVVPTYRLTNKIDSARILNNRGLKMSVGKKIDRLFYLNDAILDYHDGNYQLAKSKLERILPTLLKMTPGYTSEYDIIEAYVYLGKSLRKMRVDYKAITYFKKVDSFSKSKNFYIPEGRQAYIELIDYYKMRNNSQNQLLHINKLLHVDSIINNYYRSGSYEMITRFDNKRFIEEKERIISSLEKENELISSQKLIISIVLGISLFGVGYYYYRQRVFEKRFQKLLEKSTNENIVDNSPDNISNVSSISKKTINSLLDQLQHFEDNLEYLKPNINVKDLARKFNSNSSYLSKVINSFKEKSFSNYLNDLRIDYVIVRLREDTTLRKYTIKAIAEEIGFNNSESFSKAFYKKTGLYPSYFIKELEKKNL